MSHQRLTIHLIVGVCLLALISHSFVSAATINSTEIGESRAHSSIFGLQSCAVVVISFSHLFSLVFCRAEGRTFGRIKQFQAALLPIMYKLGVMSAVIMMTMFLAFKSVFIGTLILFLNLAFFAVKIGAYLKYEHQAPAIISAPPPSPWGSQSWGHQRDVHLHIHNSGKPEYTVPYSSLGNGWHETVSAAPIPEVQQWSPYGSHARSMNGNTNTQFTYPINARADNIDRIGQIQVTERTTQRATTDKPMVVTGQTRPVIVPPIASYHYTQNRKQK